MARVVGLERLPASSGDLRLPPALALGLVVENAAADANTAGPLPRWRRYRTVEGLVRKRSATSSVFSKRTVRVSSLVTAMGNGWRFLTVGRRDSRRLLTAGLGVTTGRRRLGVTVRHVTPVSPPRPWRLWT